MTNITTGARRVETFAGMFSHAPSGLYLTLNRAYDPYSGRWLSRDPAGEQTGGSTDLYAYVSDDPANNIDPLGLGPYVPSPGSPSTGSACGGAGGSALQTLEDDPGLLLLALGTEAVGGGPEDPLADAAVAAEIDAAEAGVVNEATSIVTSPEMADLAQAYANGESMTVSIGGRMIQYEPGLPASGMTMFGDNGFLMGPEAFQSNLEQNATVLQELYRLTFSQSGGGVSGDLATSETQSAFDFANRYAGSLP